MLGPKCITPHAGTDTPSSRHSIQYSNSSETDSGSDSDDSAAEPPRMPVSLRGDTRRADGGGDGGAGDGGEGGADGGGSPGGSASVRFARGSLGESPANGEAGVRLGARSSSMATRCCSTPGGCGCGCGGGGGAATAAAATAASSTAVMIAAAAASGCCCFPAAAALSQPRRALRAMCSCARACSARCAERRVSLRCCRFDLPSMLPCCFCLLPGRSRLWCKSCRRVQTQPATVTEWRSSSVARATACRTVRRVALLSAARWFGVRSHRRCDGVRTALVCHRKLGT
jgi:hypothetical protein